MSAEAAKAATIKRNFDSPDETRNISKGKVEVVNLGSGVDIAEDVIQVPGVADVVAKPAGDGAVVIPIVLGVAVPGARCRDAAGAQKRASDGVIGPLVSATGAKAGLAGVEASSHAGCSD